MLSGCRGLTFSASPTGDRKRFAGFVVSVAGGLVPVLY
jgi:hypothetical protein